MEEVKTSNGKHVFKKFGEPWSFPGLALIRLFTSLLGLEKGSPVKSLAQSSLRSWAHQAASGLAGHLVPRVLSQEPGALHTSSPLNLCREEGSFPLR